jgi:raffinose/stachyose/melibiose transport system substrate-binding protein
VPLYYNKALFAQYKLDPPATRNAFTKAIKTLNDHNIAPIAMCAAGANGAWVPALFMEVLVERMGGVAPYQQILDRKGDWSFVNPTFVKAGQMMQQLIGMKAFNSDFLALDADGIASMFKTNAAGMYLMGSWAVSQFNTPDSKLGADVGVVNFPGITGGTGDPNIWLGQPSVNMAMGPNNKNVPLSIAYLKAWTGTVAEKALAEVAGQIPTTRVTLDVSKVPPVFAATNDLLKKMKSMYIFYDVGLGTALGNEWNNAVVNICAGKDVTQSLQTLQNYAKSNQ